MPNINLLFWAEGLSKTTSLRHKGRRKVCIHLILPDLVSVRWVCCCCISLTLSVHLVGDCSHFFLENCFDIVCYNFPKFKKLQKAVFTIFTPNHSEKSENNSNLYPCPNTTPNTIFNLKIKTIFSSIFAILMSKHPLAYNNIPSVIP